MPWYQQCHIVVIKFPAVAPVGEQKKKKKATLSPDSCDKVCVFTPEKVPNTIATHTQTYTWKQESINAHNYTPLKTNMCRHTCSHRIHRCKHSGRNKCVNNCRWKSDLPQETSRGKKKRDLFFSFFTQTRNAQATAAAWVNKRTGLTSLSLGPGACARQHSLCCCQRGCWGLKNYTLQLKGCLCWSAKAFLSILQPTACHVLGGRPPS